MKFPLSALAGALIVAATAAAGCSAEPMSEPSQSSQSKLLAPRALFETKASPETIETLGVVEWRVYRAKKDFVLTGYDKKGKPVKGAAVSFVKDGKKDVLRARMLDGTFFAGRHVIGSGKSETNKKASDDTANLFRRAVADMMSVRASLLRNGNVKYVPPAQTPIGLDPNDPYAGMQDPFGTLGQTCGNDLTTMMMSALQCLGASGGLGAGGAANPQLLLQCALAAQGAGAAQGTCGAPMPGGGLPYDPYGMGQDPYGMGQDPYGMGQDPYGMGQDPYGMGQDPYGMGQDPSGMGGGYPMDPYGQGDPFGAGQCTSCQGGYDDFGIDPMNGGVGYPDQGGMGYPGEMGGDMGGGYPGDMGGFGEGY